MFAAITFMCAVKHFGADISATMSFTMDMLSPFKSVSEAQISLEASKRTEIFSKLNAKVFNGEFKLATLERLLICNSLIENTPEHSEIVINDLRGRLLSAWLSIYDALDVWRDQGPHFQINVMRFLVQSTPLLINVMAYIECGYG